MNASRAARESERISKSTRKPERSPACAPERSLLIATLLSITAAMSAEAQSLPFSDSFIYPLLPKGTPLDSLNNWSASSAVILQGSNPDYYAEVPVPAGNSGLFMKPWIQDPLTSLWEKAHWPVARTGGPFLQCYFDVATPTLSPTGRMLVMFDSKPDNGLVDNNLGYSDFGPLVVVEFDQSYDPITSTSTLTANVFAQAPSNVAMTGSGPIVLPTLTPTMSSFRIDFAWDYFILPHDFGSYGPTAPSRGEPWFYVRLSYLDTSTNPAHWVQAYSRPNHGNGKTDGWVEFGDETMGHLTGPNLTGKIAIDRYDWITGNWSNPLQPPTYDPVYTYWYFDQNGSGTSMTWQIDNVSISQVDSPLFTIMTNQLGYDTAGPQWAVIRVNDPALLADPLIASLVTQIDWSLTGTGISTQNVTRVAPAAQPCFMEAPDPETFLGTGGGTQGSGFTLYPEYWWRWEWNAITTPATNCKVKATIHYSTSSTSGTQTIESDPFTVSPSLAYSTIISNPSNNIAAWNGKQREASVTTHTSQAGGWFDANAENGENRAIGCFVSALSNVLMNRRNEMSTPDVHLLTNQITQGADFLTSEGAAENQWDAAGNRAHQTDRPPPDLKNDQSHHFDSLNLDEMAGHIWHESHVREHGAGPVDQDDKRNSGASEWNSCVGLLDAARALQPYGMSQASTYATQAAATRTYLEGLAAAFGHSGTNQLDFYYTFRAQAMLDFIYSEVDPTQGSFASAVSKLQKDLNGNKDLSGNPLVAPTSVDHVERFWILGTLFNTGKVANGSPDTGGMDPAVYCPADPILYALDHHVSDPQPPPPVVYAQAINNIVDLWYDSVSIMRTGSQHPNPLRISVNWSPVVTLENYYGSQIEIAKHTAEEGYAAARFAQHFGRADSRFDRLVELASGNLNYLLGMNIGIRSRQVLQASIADSVDLNRVGASLINGVGKHWGAQTVNGTEYEVWNQSTLTTMTGPGGDSALDPVTGSIANWSTSPFEYSRGLSGHGTETFIKTDANVIMLIDALDRAMHPKLVVEAESGSSSPPAMVSSNNVPPSALNGGLSVINLTSGYSLTYSPLMPPEEPGVAHGHNFRYRVRLRACNTGGSPCTVTVSVTQGVYQWSDSISVPVSNMVHNYVVVDNNSGFYGSSPLTLATGGAFSVVLSIGGTGAGPCAFDDFVIESEGIPR